MAKTATKPKIIFNSEELSKSVEFSIEYAMLEIGRSIVTHIRRSLMRPGTGNLYSSKRNKYLIPGKDESHVGVGIVSTGTIAKMAQTKSKLKMPYRTREARTFFEQKYLFGKITRHVRGSKHRASAPGYPPAPDTETLRKSIDFEVESYGGGYKRLWIMANAPYAKFLEIGTAKMAPRPFIRPAIEIYANKLGREVQKAFRYKYAGRLSGSYSLGPSTFKFTNKQYGML